MPKNEDALPSIDLAQLANVHGGAGSDDMMLPMMMMMMGKRNAAPAAAPAPPPPPPRPRIMVDGVEKQMTNTGSGLSFTNTSGGDDPNAM